MAWYWELDSKWQKDLHQPGIEPGASAWQAEILPLNHWYSLADTRDITDNHRAHTLANYIRDPFHSLYTDFNTFYIR